jgi:multiple sugar transport system substrate-binding protein
MKAAVQRGLVSAAMAALALAACAPPPTPATVVQTQVVTVVETQVVEVVKTQEVEVPVEVVVTATPAPVSGEVKVLLIGYPDQDTIDAVTGAETPGIAKLEAAFESENPTIDLQIINIPWGSGSTGYGPRTEAMVQGQEACLYDMPGAPDFGRRGYLVNLDTLIANDPSFVNVWGDQIDQWRGWGPGNPDNLWGLPYQVGNRVIHYDATLFEQWGVEPLSTNPTLEEIEQKAAAMTGLNPVTGEQNYGYWLQGKYISWQFQTIAHAMGANWGTVNADGTWSINWNTPEYLAALEWLVKMTDYAPPGAVSADAMPPGFLSDENIVAIIPEGENGYYIPSFVANPDLQQRFRTVNNLVGADGRGGLYSGNPLSMAASCPNKEAAWVALKWLAGSPASQEYNFQTGWLSAIEGGADAIPQLGQLLDAGPILGQIFYAEKRYPWATTQPRWALQSAIELALAKTITPAEALEQAQAETADWLAEQAAGASN